MRTLRELFGWALLLGAWLVPFGLLLALVAWVEREIPFGGFLLAALLACAWPRLILSSRRLREPDPRDVAEADGRRPVLLLHGFAHTRRPLALRLFAFQPELWRDWSDHLLERALVRGFGAHGPVVPFARPAPPPTHGPVRPEVDPGWERELERRIRGASRAIVVVDESEACLHEILRAAELLGLHRVILVPADTTSEAVRARWAELAEAIGGLRAPDARTAAIRFGRDGQPMVVGARFGGLFARLRLLREPRVVLFSGETRPAPRAPSFARLLPVIPAFAGLFSALATPLWLDVHGVRARGDDAEIFGLVAFLAGATLAILARRAVRLVPSNEAVMVLVAAAPWLLPLLPLALDPPSSTSRAMRYAAIGAAYAAPLLLAVGLTLAIGALVRRTPERSVAYAIFGAAALVPLATAGASIMPGTGELVLFGLVALFGAGVMALVSAAASGRAGRAHSPLPIGAAAAAALGVGAWCAFVGQARWSRLAELLGQLDFAPGMASELGSLETFARAWPLFALLGPAAVALIAAQFAGRASRVSVGNVLALAPLVLVLALDAVGPARAMETIGARNAGLDRETLERLAGPDDAERVRIATTSSYGNGWSANEEDPIDLLVDERGAHAGGALVAVPVQLAQRGRGTLGMQQAFARAPARDRAPRIAVGERADGLAVVGAAKAALAQSGTAAELVFRGPEGRPALFRIAPRIHYVDGRSPLHIAVHPNAFAITEPAAGWIRWVVDRDGRADEAGLRAQLREIRALMPNARAMVVVPTPGARADRLATALGLAWDQGYDDLALEDAVR